MKGTVKTVYALGLVPIQFHILYSQNYLRLVSKSALGDCEVGGFGILSLSVHFPDTTFISLFSSGICYLVIYIQTSV